MLWGSHTVFLHAANEDGRFEMIMADSVLGTSLTLIDQILPTYLANITPMVILDSQQCSSIRLIFLLHNRCPEIMVLPYTWDCLYARCLRVPPIYEHLMSEEIGRDSARATTSHFDDFQQLLSIYKRYSLILGAG